MAKSSTKKIEFQGQVVPYDYDDEDRVISVMIVDEDGREYQVRQDETGGQLLEFIDEFIEGKGVVKNVDGEYILTVTDFETIDEDDLDYDEDSEWDDMDEDDDDYR